MPMRGIRGATLLTADDADEMRQAVCELLQEMLTVNEVDQEQVVSIILTGTPDIHSAFPAAAARALGLSDVPLLCAQELDIDGAVALAVRVLIHADVPRSRADIHHVYLRGADVLRQDLKR
ncbi:MAG: chorismate mutase [Actinomycetota bacterium]